jgi:hypothetical protein
MAIEQFLYAEEPAVAPAQPAARRGFRRWLPAPAPAG